MAARVRRGGQRPLNLDRIRWWFWFVFYVVMILAIVALAIWGR